MTAYIVRRLGWTVLTVFVMSVIIFTFVRLIPGDPAIIILGQRADVQLAAEIRSILGLDRPWLAQYLEWMGGLFRGDFGVSLAVFGTAGPTGRHVSDIIFSALAITLTLTSFGMLLAVLVGGVSGVLGAIWRDTRKDYALSIGSFVGVSIPDFYFAILLVYLFAVRFPVLPATGWVPFGTDPYEWLRHLILPAIPLGLINAAAISRMLRANIIDVLPVDYVKAARARGAPWTVSLLKHALRNAVIPTLTIIGLQVGYLFGGAILIERVFSIPGMGWHLLEAVAKRDYTTIQGLVLVFALLFALVNLLTDIIHTMVDPRIQARMVRAKTA